METLDAIKKRYSCRSFNGEQIPDKALEEILKAGMAAPVGMGEYDALHISVIQDKELISLIGDKVTDFISSMFGEKMDKHFGEPTLIFVSSKPSNLPGMEYANVANVIENMAIAASDLGINSVVQGSTAAVINQNPEVLAKLQIPAGLAPVLSISLGYAKSIELPKEHVISVSRI